MSAFSDDTLPTQIQCAAAFADEVRQIQSKSGKRFMGRNTLSSEIQYAIMKAASGSEIVAAVSEAGEGMAVRNLLERFEEMCRRRKVNIDAELRPALVKILAGELLANHSALGGSVRKLIGVTVVQGAIGPGLIKEFEHFRETPNVILKAAAGYPSDPRAFLRKAADTVDTLATEREFERFRETPSVFTTAAVDYPNDPRAFLRKVGGHIDALASEPEFERFRETPWVIAKAAVNYPSDPRAFLRKTASTVDMLATEPEFERFRETPWVIAKAAVNCTSDPRAFLRKAASTVDMLASEPEFERFREAPWVLAKAVVNYPSDPRAFLRKAVNTVD
jgi:hypothetical protein